MNIIRAGICFGLVIFQINLSAQIGNDKNSATTIKIGDKVPNFTIGGLSNYKNPSINISDFKGKLLILDFWATWCSPCISMIPKLDSLQKVFAGKVQFLSVTYQSDAEVKKLFEKLKSLQDIKLPQITGDTLLRSFFPHKELPHYIWIDGAGTFISVTSHEEVNEKNIENILNGKKISMRQKEDVIVSYDRQVPILTSGLPIDKDKLRYQAVFLDNIKGLQSGYEIVRDETDGRIIKITATNATLELLFALAWSNGTQYFNRNRIVLDVNDPSKLITNSIDQEEIEKWAEVNTYCYELIVPKILSREVFSIMQSDFSKLFPEYKVTVKKKMLPCLVLERTSPEDKIKSTGKATSYAFESFGFDMKNCFIELLTGQLSIKYLQHIPKPVINGTNYKGRVDLSVEANLSDLQSIRNALSKYDLDLVEKDYEIDVLVVEDNYFGSSENK